MIEAKFEYSYEYIKDLNKATMKTYNLVGQIALFLILCGVAVLFGLSKNILLGVLVSITFVVLAVGFISANKAVERSNRGLLGQQIILNFSENEIENANVILRGYDNIINKLNLNNIYMFHHYEFLLKLVHKYQYYQQP